MELWAGLDEGFSERGTAVGLGARLMVECADADATCTNIWLRWSRVASIRMSVGERSYSATHMANGTAASLQANLSSE